MRQLQRLVILPVPVAFLMRARAFTRPCVYQADKCGFTLISTYGNLSHRNETIDDDE